MIQVVCDRCKLRITPATPRVLVPSALMVPPASGDLDQHFHVECWEKRKAENSNPKV